jgi:hypothetical protein
MDRPAVALIRISLDKFKVVLCVVEFNQIKYFPQSFQRQEATFLAKMVEHVA